MGNTNLQPNVPVRFEAMNPRTIKKFRTSKGQSSPFYLLEMEVTQEDWRELESLPPEAFVTVALFYHYGEDNTEQPAATVERKKQAKEKGPYGKFWQKLFADGFLNCPRVREYINDMRFERQTDKEVLYSCFNVSSLTYVSPDRLRRWIYERCGGDSVAAALIEQAQKVLVSQEVS